GIWRGPRTCGALVVSAEPHASADAGPEALAAVTALRRACWRWRREPSTRHGLMTTTGRGYTSWSIRHSTRPRGGPAGGAATGGADAETPDQGRFSPVSLPRARVSRRLRANHAARFAPVLALYGSCASDPCGGDRWVAGVNPRVSGGISAPARGTAAGPNNQHIMLPVMRTRSIQGRA